MPVGPPACSRLRPQERAESPLTSLQRAAGHSVCGRAASPLFPLPPEGSWRRPPTRVGNPRPRAWRGHGCARSSVVSPPNRSLAAVLCLGDADLPFDIPRPGSSTLKSLGLQRRALWAEKRRRDLSPGVLLPRVSGLASRVSVLRIYALGWVLEDTRKQQTQVDEKRKSKLCC